MKTVDRLVTLQEFAGLLNISVHTARHWAATRRIAIVRLGRAIRVPMREIERLVEKGTVPATREQR